MKAVILAGGYGTRLSEKTDSIPKPMVQIGDRPLLWHIMKHFSVYGVKDFIICLGYKAHIIQDYFSDTAEEGSKLSTPNTINYHGDEDECWSVTLVNTGLNTGTGGRLAKIRHLLHDERFYMTYGDGLSNVDLAKLHEAHQAGHYNATVTAISPPSRYGFLELSGSAVTSFQEKPQTPEHIRINGGFFIIEPSALNYVESDDQMWEQQPMKRLVEAGKLGAYRHNGFWHCIDTLRDYRAAETLWEEGSPPWKTWP